MFKYSSWLVFTFMFVFSSLVYAAPSELDGLVLETSWIDVENVDGDMPTGADLWGESEIQQADRVGIWVRYENGLTAWATYSGVDPGEWGTCCSISVTEETASGWLAGAVLHGIGRDDLPMAWVSASNPFTNNFDLDPNSPFGSDWRASSPGWGSVEIALYSNVAVPENQELAPVPTLGNFGLLFLLMTMSVLAWMRFRQKNI